MTGIFSKWGRGLNAKGELVGYGGHPAGSQEEWDAMVEDAQIQPMPAELRQAWVARGYEDPGAVMGLDRSEQPHWPIPDILQRAPSVDMPTVATPRSIVGGLVAQLTRSLKSSLETRGELEERIAADTETLRQVNASIAAIETALLSVSDDPALTAEERKAAVEFVDAGLVAAVTADLEASDE